MRESTSPQERQSGECAPLWATPEITNINRLPMSASSIPFPDVVSALAYERFSSPWVLRLNGTWRFRRFASPQEIDLAVITASCEPADFRDIPVPSNWTLEDTEDRPIYTNIQMPFPNTPPIPPEENPTAVYRHRFALPESWSGRRVVIHFGGVESYYELYVNGAFVGMAKDTRLPSEFEITGFLHPGQNRLAVKVLRFSDSSYIEGQDQWWMAGIYRDVYLYTTAQVYVADIRAEADFDIERKAGVLDLVAQLAVSLPPHSDSPAAAEGSVAQPSGPAVDFRIDASLYDTADRIIWSDSERVSHSFRRGAYQARFHAELDKISPWSSEDPALYRLVISLRAAPGTTDDQHRAAAETGVPIEARCVRIGFRNIRIHDRQLLLNGQPVLIRGVNRHEHDERAGKVMSRELMLTDIRRLKQFNFNAVRTSHYPNTEAWYDLCDEHGIYLVDEADIETHANYATLCRNPRYARAFEERVTRMICRDRNHPSVIIWSMGNESGHGENHIRAIERARELDPTRPIHHEGELKPRWNQSGNEYSGGDNRYNDIINPMYPTIESIVEHAKSHSDPRPVILCEYSHAMGNSNGSLADYWNAFERHHGLQGGFIWEWVDHGILSHDDRGRPYWAYGGDFGEEIHDGNFVADGLVWPDRTPHPAMWEFKKLAQPLAVRAVSVTEGRFVVESRQDFTSLEWLSGSWRLEVEGEPLDGGDLPPLAVPPGGRIEVRLTYADPAQLARPEAHVAFTFTTGAATPWCDAGHEVAWEQFAANNLRLPAPGAGPTRSVATATVDEAEHVLSAGELKLGVPAAMRRSGGDASPAFPIGEMPRSTLSFGARPVLIRGPRLNLFRAPTDNDGIRGWSGQEAKPMGQWLAAGLDRLQSLERHVETDVAAGVITELTRFVGADATAVIECRLRYQLVSPRLIRINAQVEVPMSLPSLPRVGVIMETAPGFEQLEWFGRGPHENHIDRKAGAAVGRYSGTVSAQYVPYIMPQENGNKSDVRWFELSDGTTALRFAADPVFEFSVHHVTPEDLFACRHTPEVTDRARPETVICIDAVQRGVGTGSCGPQTRDPYTVPPGRYELGFWIGVESLPANSANG